MADRPDFGKQLAEITLRLYRQEQAIVRETARRVVEVMQEPGPSRATARAAISAGEGLGRQKQDGSRGRSKRAFGPISSPGGAGLLPVDTGFLRASLVATKAEALPTRKAPTNPSRQTYNSGPVNLAIAEWNFREPLNFIYTANYARAVHFKVSPWVSLAAQQAPQIARQVRAEITGSTK